MSQWEACFGDDDDDEEAEKGRKHCNNNFAFNFSPVSGMRDEHFLIEKTVR